MPASVAAVSRSLSPSLFLFGGEGFVSTVTGSSESGIGEETLRFLDPSRPPSWRWVEAGSQGSWILEGPSQAELDGRLLSSGTNSGGQEQNLGLQEGPGVGFGTPRSRDWVRAE